MVTLHTIIKCWCRSHWEKSGVISGTWRTYVSNAKHLAQVAVSVQVCCWNRCTLYPWGTLGKTWKIRAQAISLLPSSCPFSIQFKWEQEKFLPMFPYPFSKLSTLPTLLSDKGEAKVEKEGKFITIYIIKCLFRFTKVTKTITFHVALDKSITSVVSLSVKCANSWIYFIGCLNH